MSSVPEAGLLPENRRFLKTDLAALALLAVAFAWTFMAMAVRWEQENSYYSHGWLIPPVALWLIWRKRKELATCPRTPSRAGLLLLLPSLVGHLLAVQWRVASISGFALLGALAGLVWTMLGWNYLRILLVPLAFLAFMVPLPELAIESISFRMKLLAAWAATALVNAFGLPAVRAGSYIHIAEGTLIVDDVCSGLKYLISLLAFGALYAQLSSIKTWQKWALFVLSVPVAYVANVGRVTLMVLVGHWRGIEAVEKPYYHDLFGFVMFVVAFGCLFVVESLMLMRSGRECSSAESREGSAAAPVPVTHVLPTSALQRGVLLSLALTAGISIFFAWPRPVAPASEILNTIPLQFNEWRGQDYTYGEDVYRLLGTRDVLSRTYSNDRGERVSLIVVIAQQMRRRTHPPEQCYTGEGFAIQSSSNREVTVHIEGVSRTITVRELVLSHNRGKRLSWYFFKSGDRLSTNYWRHQAVLALSKFHRPDSADVLVRFDADIDDISSGRQELQRFAEAAFPSVMLLP